MSCEAITLKHYFRSSSNKVKSLSSSNRPDPGQGGSRQTETGGSDGGGPSSRASSYLYCHRTDAVEQVLAKNKRQRIGAMGESRADGARIWTAGRVTGSDDRGQGRGASSGRSEGATVETIEPPITFTERSEERERKREVLLLTHWVQ